MPSSLPNERTELSSDVVIVDRIVMGDPYDWLAPFKPCLSPVINLCHTSLTYLRMSAVSRSNFGTLGRRAKERLQNDNDIKIIIQAKNSQTGIGKTTLAIELCRFIDENGWNAENKAFIDVQKYLNSFLDIEPQSALLLDEIGAGADNRRATSKENVELSQGWQMLRARNIATIATLPSTNMLDPRMLELADFWVLVKNRGLAQPYEIRVNDFNGRVSRKPLPGDEHIQFADLPNGDTDKEFLDSIKDEKIRTGSMETISKAEHYQQVKEKQKQAKKERRDEIIASVYNNTEMSYAEIGNIPAIDLTKQTVGEIVRNNT